MNPKILILVNFLLIHGAASRRLRIFANLTTVARFAGTFLNLSFRSARPPEAHIFKGCNGWSCGNHATESMQDDLVRRLIKVTLPWTLQPVTGGVPSLPSHPPTSTHAGVPAACLLPRLPTDLNLKLKLKDATGEARSDPAPRQRRRAGSLGTGLVARLRGESWC